jgi:hypothetical protein
MTYIAVHRALRRRRGSARGRACIVCGRASSAWSCYPCADADLIDGVNSSGRPVTYVADLDGYAPMCWHHANAHDRERAARRQAVAHLVVSPLPPRRSARTPISRSAPEARNPEPQEALFDLGDALWAGH